MPNTPAIAKRDFLPFFEEGDWVTIIPILYKKDTLLVKELWGVFKENKLVKTIGANEVSKHSNKKGIEVRKMYDEVWAAKGSYKDSVIELEDGSRYPSSLVRDYKKYFEKV
jgi:hypothetical protein